jgi:hypothetical protein
VGVDETLRFLYAVTCCPFITSNTIQGFATVILFPVATSSLRLAFFIGLIGALRGSIARRMLSQRLRRLKSK